MMCFSGKIEGKIKNYKKLLHIKQMFDILFLIKKITKVLIFL